MKKFFKSFVFASSGFRYALKEQNFVIELFCAITVIGFSIFFKINKIEWIIILINIAVVLMAELFNTAIENLCDLVHTEMHPAIKIIKDISAAAVLLVAICACICGCIIFIPHFFNT